MRPPLSADLSFSHLRERERTKHVHRLHPYKGKYIPQLVEYFLDSHTDSLKQQVFFQPGDVILDPFVGSGTTLVQANECGIHAIGIDTAPFSVVLSNLKLAELDLLELSQAVVEVESVIYFNSSGQRARRFEEALSLAFRTVNHNDMSPDDKLRECRRQYRRLLSDYGVSDSVNVSGTFMEKWYFESTRAEVYSARDWIDSMYSPPLRDMLNLILSRAVRSARITTHNDLGSIRDPVVEPYLCRKHSRVCRPLFSALGHWRRYAKDTVDRLYEFLGVRTQTHQVSLFGDARSLNLIDSLRINHPELHGLVSAKGIQGVFSSPPYVGIMDYHAQHEYAYDLFDMPSNRDVEIGSVRDGKSRKAVRAYVQALTDVLLNIRPHLSDGFHVFLVANDDLGLYDEIAASSDLVISDQFIRPVTKRTEGKQAYSEIVFHLEAA